MEFIALSNILARGEVANLETLHLMLERMVSSTIYKFLIVIILTGIAILAIYQIWH